MISPTRSRHDAVPLSQLNTYSRSPPKLSRKPGAHVARTIITMQIPFVVCVCHRHILLLLYHPPPNHPIRCRICAPAPFQTCLRHCHLQANHSDFSITTNANGFYRRAEPAEPRAAGAREERRGHARVCEMRRVSIARDDDDDGDGEDTRLLLLLRDGVVNS